MKKKLLLTLMIGSLLTTFVACSNGGNDKVEGQNDTNQSVKQMQIHQHQ